MLSTKSELIMGKVYYQEADREFLEANTKYLGEPFSSVATNWYGARFECTGQQLVVLTEVKKFHVVVYNEVGECHG